MTSVPAGPTAAAPSDAAVALEQLRLQLQRSVRTLITGASEPPQPTRTQQRRRSDTGLFGPDSVTWRVHGDASMLVGGLRALLLQTMHPLAMAGIAAHSGYRGDPLGRLHRTSAYVGITTFGTRSDARKAVARVRAVHESVRGTAPDGRPYAANDPHLLAWVHHTLVDSFLRAYRCLGSHDLAPEDADAYVAEQATLAELIGAIAPAPARSVAELRAWMAGIRPELLASKDARDAARFLLFPPMPTPVLPAYAVTASAAVGLLPPWVRRELRIPTVPFADRLLVRPVARALTRTIGWALQPPLAAASSSERDGGRPEGRPPSRSRRSAAAPRSVGRVGQRSA